MALIQDPRVGRRILRSRTRGRRKELDTPEINGLKPTAAGRDAAMHATIKRQDLPGNSQATKEITEARRGEQSRLDCLANGAKNFMRPGRRRRPAIGLDKGTPGLFDQVEIAPADRVGSVVADRRNRYTSNRSSAMSLE